ncbi:MAG: ferritin-like domain-containing protein [Gemmatimonadota bacterium]
MASAPRTGIPALAGLCSLKDATRIGYTVDESVSRLLRYHWIEKRLSEIAVARLTATPEWELKGAFALHQWLDSEHAGTLRERIREMRHPTPRLDRAPAGCEAVEEVAAANTTAELLERMLRVRQALLADYTEHYEHTNPVVDHPTRRLLRFIIIEETEMIAWLEQAVAAAPASVVERDFVPRRDARFRESCNFNFPPHNVYALPYVPAEERNLALLCKRLLEMDVPEMMASFITERTDQPWEFYRDYKRQLWDEARHSMMGEIAFEARAVDWTRIPLNVGFALRLNLHATPEERQLLLYAIEQSLMPGDTGKRYEHNTAVAAGDELSAHFQDYDWADEVLHAQIGRRWLKPDATTLERGSAVHEKTWSALDAYRAQHEQRDWWNDFVRAVLGRESEARPEDLIETKVVAE